MPVLSKGIENATGFTTGKYKWNLTQNISLYSHTFLFDNNATTVKQTTSDGDVILCLLLLSKTLTCTLHLS